MRRRAALVTLVAALAPAALITPGAALARTASHTPNLTHLVSPFVGTDTTQPSFGTGGSSGGTFPGAVAPHGMIQWSPDTIPSTVNFSGGYTYSDTETRGFSLTHLSGAGCSSLEDVPILPTTTPVTSSPAVLSSSELAAQYVATFNHRDEQAHPGFYGVTLDPDTPDAVGVALTTPTQRTALGSFSFPRGHAGSVLVNAGGSALGDYTADVSIAPGKRLITGSAASGEFCYAGAPYTVYFAIQFSRGFSAFGTWKQQTLHPGATTGSDSAHNPGPILTYQPIPDGPASIPGDPSGTAQTGAYVTFARGGTVEARVAISYVSVAGALVNLRSGARSWSFGAARRAAKALWQRTLQTVQAQGGTRAQRITFYTALYHALIAPEVFDDADGDYLGMDGHVHRAIGYTQYATFSGWDTYRTEFPLTAMLTPRVAGDEVTSLLADQAQSGWLPKWSFLADQTQIEVGDPADAMIADAWALGARHFDGAAALAAMLHGATTAATSGYVERPGLADYERLHYLPEELNAGVGTDAFGVPVYVSGGVIAALVPDLIWGPAAETLEYTADDFAIAHLAGQLGASATCRTFLARSGYWQSLLNPATRYLQPRYATGLFDLVFDPTSSAGWVEGSTAQYTWSVPYDVGGLFAAMGGSAVATARLEHLFTELNAGPTSTYAFLGNEPTLATPWLYDWSVPALTQATVRRAVLALYGPGPDDYPGNDDLGTMSAWVVFADLGLYPEIAGTDTLVLASPLFPRITLHLPSATVTIVGHGAGAASPYVNSLRVDGKPHPADWIPFAALRHGATLRFDLAPSPPRRGGLTPAPPSYSTAATGAVCGSATGRGRAR